MVKWPTTTKRGFGTASSHVLLDGRVTLSGTMSNGTSAVVEALRPGGPSRLLVINATEPRRLLNDAPRWHSR